MSIYLIVLRLLHIVAGTFWAGTTFFMVSFMYPAISLAGPGGGGLYAGAFPAHPL